MNKPIISIICVIVAIIFIVGAVIPKYQSLQNKNELVVAKELDLQNRSNYYAEIAQISEELKNYADTISKIDSALPASFSVPSIYNFFQEIAASSGMTLKQISGISSDSSLDSSGLKENTLSLSLVGFYPDFKGLLNVMENSARLIEVTSISFSSSGDETSPFTFNVGVKFYSYQD
jgi:Tfp pilus assembly protein PilO